MRYNFIVAKLGNNDFGYTMKCALSYINEQFKLSSLTATQIRCMIIEYVLFNSKMIDIYTIDKNVNDSIYDRAVKLREYLQYIDISFERNMPDFDDDGGSAYFDLNLENSYTY